MNINDLRQEYGKFELLEENLPQTPQPLFEVWFAQALELEKTPNEPNAFHLATVDKNNEPNLRVLLLKEFNEHGFIFFGNYESDKGQNLQHKNIACMNFFWPAVQRQVRIKGEVAKISNKESEDYYFSRPFASQLGAHSSPQSRIISSRTILEDNFQNASSQFNEQNITKPDYWGGWLLKPYYFEFWQGRASRLHDRIIYKKNEDNWQMLRLAP
jgi:pyridoxamine 5'-phosphate oxidase